MLPLEQERERPTILTGQKPGQAGPRTSLRSSLVRVRARVIRVRSGPIGVPGRGKACSHTSFVVKVRARKTQEPPPVQVERVRFFFSACSLRGIH